MNRHRSYCHVLLLNVFFSVVLCLNKCKRRHSSPLKKKSSTSVAQIDAEGEEFDVLQAEFFGEGAGNCTGGCDLPG